MILNLSMCASTYSIILTLRERQTVIYILILIFGAFEGIMTLLFQEAKLGNLQVLGKMINVVLYLVLAYLTSKNYYIFKKMGGLHGVRTNEDMLEDKLLAKTK